MIKLANYCYTNHNSPVRVFSQLKQRGTETKGPRDRIVNIIQLNAHSKEVGKAGGGPVSQQALLNLN